MGVCAAATGSILVSRNDTGSEERPRARKHLTFGETERIDVKPHYDEGGEWLRWSDRPRSARVKDDGSKARVQRYEDMALFIARREAHLQRYEAVGEWPELAYRQAWEGSVRLCPYG